MKRRRWLTPEQQWILEDVGEMILFGLQVTAAVLAFGIVCELIVRLPPVH